LKNAIIIYIAGIHRAGFGMTRTLVASILCLVSITTPGSETLDLNRPDFKNLQNQARLDKQKWDNNQTRTKLNTLNLQQRQAKLMSALSNVPVTIGVPASQFRLSHENLAKFLELLGNPQENSGIYEFPEDQRLFQYGMICIEVGLVEQGVNAISEHMRINAEIAARVQRKPENRVESPLE
jgi:hypothetical protein